MSKNRKDITISFDANIFEISSWKILSQAYDDLKAENAALRIQNKHLTTLYDKMYNEWKQSLIKEGIVVPDSRAAEVKE